MEGSDDTIDLLLCVDGSENSVRAAEHAAMLAKASNGQITLLTVLKPDEAEAMDWKNILEEDSAENISRIGGALVVIQKEGAEYVISVQVGDPAEVIMEMAPNYDAVIMGYKGHGFLQDTLMGSITRKVIHGAEVPVTLVP